MGVRLVQCLGCDLRPFVAMCSYEVSPAGGHEFDYSGNCLIIKTHK